MYKVKGDIVNHINSNRTIKDRDIKGIGEYKLTEFRKVLGATESQFEIVFKEKIIYLEDGGFTDMVSLPKSIFDVCFERVT